MKVVVKVDQKVYEVEVGDLHARPIVATVDGERLEVWPAEELSRPQAAGLPAASPSVLPAARPAEGGPAPTPGPGPVVQEAVPAAQADALVSAPIPGVVVSIAVKPGDRIAVGQELLVLEAMKMKNAIRASRPGEVAAVRVALGQHVKHGDVLVEYAA